MAFEVYPPVTAVSGDPASQTFGATTSGTFILSTALAVGVYEITTDTVQSSFTLGLADADGIRYTGTIRGGKGYISVATPVTRIVIPSGMTYPVNINIRLGSYTQIAAPTSASFNWVANQGPFVTFTFTAPAGTTAIVAYFRDGTSTTLASTSSPSANVAIPGTYATGNNGFAVLVAKDANGNTGLGVSLTTTSTYVLPPFTGGTPTTYTSGSTTYLVNTFTGSGTLTVNTTSNIEYMVVSGGGAGAGGGTGSSWNGSNGEVGGGGGAGGLLTGTRTSVAPGTYTVTVGGGGVTPPNTTTPTSSGSGNTSTLAFTSAVTVVGGGGGGAYGGGANSNVSSIGRDGACGGGGGMSYGGGNFAGGTGSVGYSGGAGRQYNANNGGGGGGGGMGAAGVACANTAGAGPADGTAGAGGIGITNSLRTGSAVYYCGGGGGSSGSATVGRAAGGAGGGGTGIGNNLTINLPATNGAENSGGGGGAGSLGNSAYALGGSGIVVVRVAL